jgi:hypothetical protein
MLRKHFDCDRFGEALVAGGFRVIETRTLRGGFEFFVADQLDSGDARV